MARKHWLQVGDVLQQVGRADDAGLVLEAWNHPDSHEPCVKIWWFNGHSPYVEHYLCTISHDPINNLYGYKVVASVGED